MMSTEITEHSARVRIWLEVDDLCVAVAQVGEWSLVLAATNAAVRISGSLLGHLIVMVDNDEREYPVAIRRQRSRVVEFDHFLPITNCASGEPSDVPF